MAVKEEGVPPGAVEAPCADAQERSPTPPGWNSLDEPPGDGDLVEGLMASGRTADAEWWGPVPEELQTPHWDGSGWAFDALPFDDLGASEELIAWRPYPAARNASPQGNSGRGQ